MAKKTTPRKAPKPAPAPPSLHEQLEQQRNLREKIAADEAAVEQENLAKAVAAINAGSDKA